MKHSKSVQITFTIVVGVIIISLLGFSLINSFNPYQKNTISVNGASTIETTPDLVTVYFSVETKGETSKEAEDANSQIVNDLINQIKTKSFSKNDLKTQNYNIYPEYSWKTNERELIGYIATHSLKIEFSAEETEKIGEVIDAGTTAGAGISYINFELGESLQQQYKSEAIKLASQDAKIKAEALAEGFDKRLGKLVSVSLNEFYYSPWNIYSSRGADLDEEAGEAKQAVTSIQPSEKDISASVIAVYKLR